MAIQATLVIRQMRGGSQSRLVYGHDGNLWVVKFQNNPQHVRVLANEFLGTKIAKQVGLSVPHVDEVEIAPWLYAASVDLEVDFGRGHIEVCNRGPHFGSRFVGDLSTGSTVDYLAESYLSKVSNKAEFAGILAFDKWTGNCDGRQCVFTRKPQGERYQATFIDQGFCFSAGDWVFRDPPLRGVYLPNTVYEHIRGWDDFSPWLDRLEQFDPAALWRIAKAMPSEWYGDETEDLERLCEQLLKRRSRIRELILDFRNSDRNPFPLWRRSMIVPDVDRISSLSSIANGAE